METKKLKQMEDNRSGLHLQPPVQSSPASSGTCHSGRPGQACLQLMNIETIPVLPLVQLGSYTPVLTVFSVWFLFLSFVGSPVLPVFSAFCFLGLLLFALVCFGCFLLPFGFPCVLLLSFVCLWIRLCVYKSLQSPSKAEGFSL